jgi:hypothetical protein
MKQTSNINEDFIKSNVKWKVSLNRTASFNKIGSDHSLVKEEKENQTKIKIQNKNHISSKSKESN